VYDDFVIALNPEEGSTLPYLLRIPLGAQGVVLKARETWPRTSKVYCHRAAEWPDDVEVVERVPVRSCERRGASIDLVLDRGRENRSQFVLTRIRGGREAVFWQTARTNKQARPNVGIPKARAAGLSGLEIVVDSHERYAYSFSHQQVTTTRAALVAGDYGVVNDGRLIASVERKSLADLVSTLTSGKLKYAMADLAALPRAAVVVEDRYSQVFKLERVRPAVVADGLAEVQVRWPSVPIVFCETRHLAEEWTYRFLAAASVALAEADAAEPLVDDWAAAGALAPAPASNVQIRAWAVSQGYGVSDRGRLPAAVVAAYRSAHAEAD
jgi:ERCC4 domain/Lsr2